MLWYKAENEIIFKVKENPSLIRYLETRQYHLRHGRLDWSGLRSPSTCLQGKSRRRFSYHHKVGWPRKRGWCP